MTTATTATLRSLDSASLTSRDLHRWSALESLAIEPNAYASPHFVVPALRHLDPAARCELVFIEPKDVPPGASLKAVFAVIRRRGNLVMPLPHAELYQSIHSFYGAPLIAPNDPVQAWQMLFDHLRSGMAGAFALVVRNIEQEGPAHRALRAACTSGGFGLHDSAPRLRAMLYPPDTGDVALKRALGKQHAEWARCRRRLNEVGQLSWHLHRSEIESRAIEDFLRLEHAGWKGEEGSSLRSAAHEEAFFVEMLTAFATEGRALVTELRLDDKTIASTSNLVSGTTGFAFKVGWDPQYRKFGVGIVNEAELVRQAPQTCADLREFDSGAEPASFIEKLWSGRRRLVTSVITFNALARSALRTVHWGKSIRTRLASPPASGAETG